MPLRQEMETDRFAATAEDGSVHAVVELTSFIQMVTFRGPAGWVPEDKSYRLDNGDAVEQTPDGGFRIAGSGLVLRRSV
ncbi:hypothetical protein TSH100_26330 [Azospirillum sp. TSH100]|uniref:hypothetical protein n=1 Tax=Azospirillum sp. TSH100 TaxID=652764 RepID=UPI000D60E16C|nr:hypothetical protein [Azospirillum sp. TSH100]PWC81707.1 hypothetical protein TSH100_26330 [Azospirillum sp. TSH100]QCG88975.1 hypothetical protein E6C72_14195 [Azospirillum sp. TSH100]